MIRNSIWYSREHNWALIQQNIVVVGVTKFAVDSLGEVIFITLPEKGKKLEQFEKYGEIESLKIVSELYCPVAGFVFDHNDKVIGHPELVNHDPYNSGWLLKIEISDELQLKLLMDESGYDQYVGGM